MEFASSGRRSGKVQALAEYLAGTLTAVENDKAELIPMKRDLIAKMTDDMVRRVLEVLGMSAIPEDDKRQTLYTLAKAEREALP